MGRNTEVNRKAVADKIAKKKKKEKNAVAERKAMLKEITKQFVEKNKEV